MDYSTSLQLTCPENNVDLWHLPEASDVLPMTKCRVCGFGQEHIIEYRVYLVDAVQRRLTPALAVVPKDVQGEICCRVDSYRAHIFTVLPTGYTRFMVVPVSNLGNEMPAGTLSDDVVDNERGEMYHLGIFPPGNFSFLVGVADDIKVGNGSLMLRSPRHEVQLPCSRLRLLEHAVVVPVLDRIANVGLRPMSKVSASVVPVRGFASRSMPRLGHNLEDHFDFAEFTCKMHSPIAEYMFWGIILSTFITSFGPLLHSNYYFTGRFLPKDLYLGVRGGKNWA
eukprot:s2618_g2.t1